MCCVAQFYKITIEELCNTIEEDFVSSVKQKQWYKVWRRRDVYAMKHKRHGVEALLNIHYLEWFQADSKRYVRGRQIRYLVSRGMLAVWKLTNAPFQTARQMVVWSYVSSEPSYSVFKRLNRFDYRFPRYEGDGPHSSSPGWQWATFDGRERGQVYAPANYGLRNQGYIFWDRSRLEKAHQFQAPYRSTNLSSFPAGYKGHEDGPSVSTMLQEFQIRRGILEPIKDEIDGSEEDERDGDVISWRNPVL